MPIYEYQCKKCHEIEEVWQKISDPAPRKCPKCSGPLKKLISQTAFQLKGSGWYKDLYSSSKKESKKEEAKNSESKPAEVKKESKSEASKSEKKKEPKKK